MFRNCYHFCTTALRDGVLCKDREDYLFMWNSLIVISVITGIRIYCMCLMSNHFHLLVTTTPEQADRYMELFKVRAGRYLKKKYGKTVTEGLEYKLFSINDRRAFCQEVAYILRNPYKARISGPLNYLWNSAGAYFPVHKAEGSPVGSLTFREQNTLLHTRQELPEGMRVSPSGQILAETAVDGRFVEKMFDGSSVEFFELLRKWGLDDLVEEKHGEVLTDSFSDAEVMAGIRETCRDQFSVPGPESLDGRSLSRLTRRIQSRFGSSRAQLLRLLPIDNYFLDRLL